MKRLVLAVLVMAGLSSAGLAGFGQTPAAPPAAHCNKPKTVTVKRGQNKTLNVSNANVVIGRGSNVTVNGSGNCITITGGTLAVNGSSNYVNGSFANIAIKGTHDFFNSVSGGNNVNCGGNLANLQTSDNSTDCVTD